MDLKKQFEEDLDKILAYGPSNKTGPLGSPPSTNKSKEVAAKIKKRVINKKENKE